MGRLGVEDQGRMPGVRLSCSKIPNRRAVASAEFTAMALREAALAAGSPVVLGSLAKVNRLAAIERRQCPGWLRSSQIYSNIPDASSPVGWSSRGTGRVVRSVGDHRQGSSMGTRGIGEAAERQQDACGFVQGLVVLAAGVGVGDDARAGLVGEP